MVQQRVVRDQLHVLLHVVHRPVALIADVLLPINPRSEHHVDVRQTHGVRHTVQVIRDVVLANVRLC